MKGFVFVSCLVLGMFLSLTIQRNEVWRNPVTLWEDTARKSPDKPRPRLELGNAYRNAGMTNEALAAYMVTMDLARKRDDWEHEMMATINVAEIRIGQGETELAWALLEYVVSRDPENYFARNNRAVILLNQNRPADALNELDQIRGRERDNQIETDYNRGEAWRLLGDCQKANEYFGNVAKWGIPTRTCP